MNILITCHKPPGFEHPNLYQLNINKYKKNKTRKNIAKKLNHKGNTIYYLDTSDRISYLDHRTIQTGRNINFDTILSYI